MNIALVILHADRRRGGAETYTLDLTTALTRRGHRVSLVASSFADEPSEVKQVLIPTRSRTRIGRYRQFVGGVEEHLQAAEYNIVHAMLPLRSCDVYHPHAGLAVAETADAPLAALLNPRRIAMARIERALIGSDARPLILCLSQYTKTDVRDHYELPEDRLPVLFNAVDTHHFTPATRNESNKLTALIIAQDFERKGLEFAIRAMAKLDEPSLRLRVIGKPDPTRYRKLAKSVGISDRVDFAGPTANPAAEYRDADFFILPTKHDPCSLVVLEALASGLPVISTKFNGATEIMTNGVHGLILQAADDINALADAMKQLLDPATRRRMSLECCGLRDRLSYDAHIDRLISIYETLDS